ncbi:hypothetical protein [Candidatus Accumulibacter vicinus]|uniref:hypothetical protein n=1 Tax=Candidatus Accumulibacter vicinus TaxID=2954382 RepID=UPI00235B6095|nr:hypothetical protein [Candidatus Accumulibacter vicinus]
MLLVLLSTLRWKDTDSNAIALIVSVVVAISSLPIDYFDDGILDPFFIWAIGIVWFASLIVGMLTGWLVRMLMKQVSSPR